MTIIDTNTTHNRNLRSLTTEEYWGDWKWQLSHSIRDLDAVEDLLGVRFLPGEREELEKTISYFPMAITPYFLSLVDPANIRQDPVFLQSVPSKKEMVIEEYEQIDPLSEDSDSPVPGITHRYPDRVLFLVSNTCAMYCRHCTRKRRVGDIDQNPDTSQIEQGLAYIRSTPQVRDVLLSGGDPLMLQDDYLDWILTELNDIPHVEVIRLGTRIPSVLPFRVTDDLVSILSRHHPLWMNFQFNHPRELTAQSRAAVARLADAGIPLGNQSVLLAGVNDCPRIMKDLVQGLVMNRIRPYYLYQCDLSQGISHFRTPVSKGIEIMEHLRGHTSGFAIPTYVVDAPGGGGKIPVMPQYLISCSPGKVVLRNYEGMICTYHEPTGYQGPHCDGNCSDCRLERNDSGDTSLPPGGIASLLADDTNLDSLIPAENDRITRRDNG